MAKRFNRNIKMLGKINKNRTLKNSLVQTEINYVKDIPAVLILRPESLAFLQQR